MILASLFFVVSDKVVENRLPSTGCSGRLTAAAEPELYAILTIMNGIINIAK